MKTEKHRRAIARAIRGKWRSRAYRQKQRAASVQRFGRVESLEVPTAAFTVLMALPVNRFIEVCRALLKRAEQRTAEARRTKDERQLKKAVERWNEQVERQRIKGNAGQQQ
jgi:hypothetical protein